jgi:hypothetical protein
VPGHGSGGALGVADRAVHVAQLDLEKLGGAQVDECLLLTRQQLDALVGGDLLVSQRQIGRFLVTNCRAMQFLPRVDRHFALGDGADQQLQHHASVIEPFLQLLGHFPELHREHADAPTLDLGLGGFGLRRYAGHAKAGRQA